MFCGHSLSRTPPACLENLALSAQSAWCGIEAMGETDTQLDEPGRGVYVGKDEIIHEKENWSWKGGWTERGGRGAVLGAEARLPEASGRRPPLGWVLRVGAQRRRPTTGCALEVQFSLRLGNSSLSKFGTDFIYIFQQSVVLWIRMYVLKPSQVGFGSVWVTPRSQRLDRSWPFALTSLRPLPHLFASHKGPPVSCSRAFSLLQAAHHRFL